MDKNIKYWRQYNEQVEIEYTDEDLIKTVQCLSSEMKSFANIGIVFCNRDERYAEVLVYLYDYTLKGMSNQRTFCMHDIDLEEEHPADCIKEIQREKRILQKAFPNIKVSSNLRYR